MKPKPLQSICVNGLDDEESIANHFSSKYEVLYNSVASDEQRMEEVATLIGTNAVACSLNEYLITPSQVKNAIKLLKHGKRDGDLGLVSSHLRYAPEF